MYTVIYTPSNSTATSPDLCYNPMGRLSDEEIQDLEQELQGSLCQVKIFEDKQEFNSHLSDLKDQYFSHRCR